MPEERSTGTLPAPVEAILFDFDGVILDTETAAFQAWSEVYENHGSQLTRDIWLMVYGGTGWEWDHFAHLESISGAPIDRDQVNANRSSRKRALIGQEHLMPGIMELIIHARACGIAMGVVSNAGSEWVEPYLTQYEIRQYFDLVVCGEHTSRPKPDPEIYLTALSRLGCAPGRAIAIEDSPKGVEAAQSAGIFCIAVPNPISAQFGIDFSHADLVLTSLADLQLASLRGAREYIS